MKVSELSSARLHMVLAALLSATLARAQGMALQPNGAQKPSAAVPLPANTPTSPQPLPQLRSTITLSTVQRARVDYANGLLTVTANSSSLNQILREVARQTGIQIAGGVTDERVFGTYGPADLPAILAVLLDGTGSNMMLSGDHPGSPKLLTLTPRQGGASPPGPQQTLDTDDSATFQDLPPQRTPRTDTNPVAQPQTVQPQAFTPPTAQPYVNAPTASTTTDQPPRGVTTPQQIYDQLMKLQSQQPKPPQ